MEAGSPCRSKNVNLTGDENRAFVERVCLPFLLSSQNTDGGWGFRPDARSRVEASAWALLALRECAMPRTLAEPTARGFRFLEATQLPDGAWPASSESREGCWVTALACWALLGLEEFSGSVRRGLSWICADQPGEARLLWRLLRRLHRIRRVSSQKDSYYGWSWTLGTASWVEPTSSAMIVLGSAHANLLPAASAQDKIGGSHAIRSHVSGRRMELRQSDGLRRAGRAPSRHHGVGASRAAATRRPARESTEHAMARASMAENAKRGVSGHGAPRA